MPHVQAPAHGGRLRRWAQKPPTAFLRAVYISPAASVARGMSSGFEDVESQQSPGLELAWSELVVAAKRCAPSA